jgi:hypothetical protein
MRTREQILDDIAGTDFKDSPRLLRLSEELVSFENEFIIVSSTAIYPLNETTAYVTFMRDYVSGNIQ